MKSGPTDKGTMTDLTCNLEAFKRMCKELIDVAPDLDDAGFDNALKCLNIDFMNFQRSSLELHQATYAREVTLREIDAFNRLAAMA